MSRDYCCWQCGATLADLILPLSRREVCLQCKAWHHVCKMCQFYRPQNSNHCNEERADPPGDAGVANFCDYFSPAKKPAGKQKSARSKSAKADLEALFGDASSGAPENPGNGLGGQQSQNKLLLSLINYLVKVKSNPPADVPDHYQYCQDQHRQPLHFGRAIGSPGNQVPAREA